MTDKTKEALKLALAALEEVNYDQAYATEITAIREALAKQLQKAQKFDSNDSFAAEEAAQARVREFMRNH